MFSPFMRFDTPMFNDFSRMLRLMDEMFDDSPFSDIRSTPSGTFPGINVGETQESLNVYVFAPGLAREDIELSVEDHALIIRGRRPAEGDGEGRSWFRRERFHGEFQRAIRLPDYADADHVEAQLRDGVLSVRLRKREETRPRKIEIQAA